MAFRPKSPPPPRREREPDEFASVVLERPRAVMATDLGHRPPPVRPVLKLPRQVRTRQDLRDSAKGERCTLRIVGACNHDPETTVLCHLPELVADRGLQLKGIDEGSAFGCSACHDVLDGRRPLPPGASRTSVMLDFLRAHMETLVRWKQRGLL